MSVADIPEVVAVERASYSMTWPRKAYLYELQQNKLAHYYVLRFVGGSQVTPPTKNLNLDQPWVANRKKKAVIGLAGFWLMANQIHISTVAVHPQWRGLGLGEWLLITLLEAGQSRGAESVTLEVRPSNQVARALYRKYDFREVDRRPRYYIDNNEDALVFTTPSLTLPDYQQMLQQRKEALFQRLAKIRVINTSPIDQNSDHRKSGAADK